MIPCSEDTRPLISVAQENKDLVIHLSTSIDNLKSSLFGTPQIAKDGKGLPAECLSDDIRFVNNVLKETLDVIGEIKDRLY